MRLVLDTNVLLSALMSPASVSAQILLLWRDRKVEVLTAAEQIDEIARVTRYPRIRARLLPLAADRNCTQDVNSPELPLWHARVRRLRRASFHAPVRPGPALLRRS